VEPVKILPVTPVTCGAREDSSNDSRSLWSPFPICGDKQGRARRPRQPLRGAGRGAISIKEILGENQGTYI